MISIQQLENWIKAFAIFDDDLKPLPAELVAQLSRPLRERWIKLNRGYYETQGTSSAPTTR